MSKMMIKRIAVLLTLLNGLMSGAFAQQPAEWAFKEGPLKTKWADKIDPAHPLPEYPRPQMVRTEWLSLNGIWEFQSGSTDDAVPVGKLLSGKILVPYPAESALSGVMKHDDRLWYRRKLTIPAAWKGKHVLLHFEAVDYEAEVYLNGKRIGTHKGGYDAFSFDITPYLIPGNQELIVRVYDPTEDYGKPRGKQTNHPGGIMYTPTTGIWQSVWMEPVAVNSIVSLKIVPDVDGKRVKITVNSSVQNGLTARVAIKEGAKYVSIANGNANQEISLPVPDAKLWSPDKPFLYNLSIALLSHGKPVDTVSSYFGMRKIAITDDGGYKKIYLNNHFLYEMGLLDQGFWPDGIYTAPTDEALRSDIEQAKNLGFNLIRKHIKVEPQRWYYWADKLGILVWQDMPSVNSYLPQNAVRPAIDEPEFKSELHRLIVNHWNSPSIIMWVLFNESQGQHDTENLVKFIHDLDPSRLIDESSGDKHYGFGDVIDRHSYPPPNVPESKTQAIVIGEFGGIGYGIKGHTWAAKADGYTNVFNAKDFIFLYAEFAGKLKNFVADKGLSASIYTQLTDVETETNGVLTYDRIPKAEAAAMRKINAFQFIAPTYQVILSTSEAEAQDWKYTTDKPAGNWNKASFDDAAWLTGKGGFGKVRNWGNTPWNTSDIWMRKTFNVGNLTAAQLDDLVIRILHDDQAEVFVNGVAAYNGHGFRGDYENRGLNPDARHSIKLNAANIIAIHCHKKNAGQYIDAGIYLRIPAAN